MRKLLPLALFAAAILRAQPLPISTPQAEGFSPDRLARLHQNFEQITQQGKRGGVITMIVRNGKIADWIDPKERTVALLFMQYMPYDTATLKQFSTLFYQSIVD